MAVLDVGANVAIQTEHFMQFAQMGIAYQKSLGIIHPTVGLLNIGAEEKKGTPQLREAYQKLQELNHSSQIFLGNVEGKDVFQGKVDVLVTDGFTGNVFLKTAEGIGAFILDLLNDSAFGLGGLLSKLKQRLHWSEYPGAILCGVDGIVIKCHGDGSPKAVINSIKEAVRLVEQDFIDKIKGQL